MPALDAHNVDASPLGSLKGNSMQLAFNLCADGIGANVKVMLPLGL